MGPSLLALSPRSHITAGGTEVRVTSVYACHSLRGQVCPHSIHADGDATVFPKAASGGAGTEPRWATSKPRPPDLGGSGFSGPCPASCADQEGRY